MVAESICPDGQGEDLKSVENLNFSDLVNFTKGFCPGEMYEGHFYGISTDSRTIKKGEIFIALKGDRFDGHKYIKDAVLKGATTVIAENGTERFEIPLITVADSLTALGDLANGLRRREKLKILAITGSVGKSTVKEISKSILSESKNKIFSTPGNYNNLIGLPLTLLSKLKGQSWGVLEMGCNQFGEIKRLTEIADPDVALITAIGKAHLEFFGSLKEVSKAKGELFKNLKESAVAVINADEPLILEEAKNFKGNKLYYGEERSLAQIKVKVVEDNGVAGQKLLFEGLGLNSKGLLVNLLIPGTHNAKNALASVAAAVAFGMEEQEIKSGLEKSKSLKGRLFPAKTKEDFWIIDDSYNANPTSMEAGLDFIGNMKGNFNCSAILGDMLELGAEEGEFHFLIGKKAAKAKITNLALVGTLIKETARGAILEGLDSKNVKVFKDPLTAAEWMHKKSKPGDRILIKGSHALGLEEAVAYFLASNRER